MKSSASAKVRVKTFIKTIIFCLFALLVSASQSFATTQAELQEILKKKYPDGLPRYVTPEEKQWMIQNPEPAATKSFMTMTEQILMAPPPGTVRTPAEYEPIYGTMICWEAASADQQAILTDYVVGVTTDPNMNSLVFIGVSGASQQTSCTTTLTTHSPAADMDRVRFFYYDFDSLWICDYGPRSILQNSNISSVIDHKYNRTRAKDDAYPAFSVTNSIPWPQTEPLFNFGGDTDAGSIIHGGGNFLSFSNGDGFSSRLIVDENPTRTEASILADFTNYFNINETLFPRLLTTMDSTSHIDMWFMPIGDNKVVISQFPTGTSYADSKSKTDAAAAAMQARGYTVYRTPAWSSSGNETGGGTHYTYTNIAIVNKKVFVPTYNNTTNDNAAIATYTAALPGYTIVRLDCSGTISLAGAIHCIIKHVYIPQSPFGEVLTPNGGETFKVGQSKQIKWIANGNSNITGVDLYYSSNNGSSWNTIATGESHDGSYTWTIPSADSTQCQVKVIVHDANGGSYEDVSNSNFTITPQLPIQFVAAGTAQTGTSTITVPWPAHQAGDVALLFIESCGGETANLATPAGFAAVLNSPQATGSGTAGTRITAYWCRATSSSMSSPVVSDPGDHVYGRIFTFRNVISTGNPWDVTAGGVKATASTTSTFGAVTTTIDNDMIVLAAARDNDSTSAAWSNWTNANLTGLTEQSDGGTTSGGGGGLGIATGTKLTAGSTGSSTATVTSSMDGHMTIALKPEPPVVGAPGQATNPNPANSAASVSVTQDLSWTAGADTTSHNVYFGTANPPASQGNQAGTSFDTGTMANGATYYWRIDEVGTGGTTEGTVWSFSTIYERTLTSSSTDGGDVTTPGEGAFQFDDGSNVNITASTNANYHFVNWTGSAVSAGKVANPDSASTTVLMDADYTVQANFAIDQKTLTTSSTTGGDVTTPGESTYQYDHGAIIDLVAAADAGFYFVNWTGDTGTIANATAASTTITMNGNYAVVANFALTQFAITASAGSNGAINPLGTFNKDFGSSQLFIATPATGYEVDTWYLDGSPVQTGGTNYTLTGIVAVHSVNVTFKIQTFSVTGTAGANGSINPTGTFSKDYGSNQLFTATPATGYQVDTWYVDGSPVQTGGTTHTLSSITATHTINVTFKIQTFSVTGTAGANGSINPTGTFSRDYGSNQLFAATPTTGYEVDKWQVDGIDAQTGGIAFTLSDITANHIVTVSFKIMTYSVTASAGANGSVSPLSAVIDYDGSQLFTASPAMGYEVDKWQLDGSDIQTGGNTYSLSNITATHAVTVSFKIMTYLVTASAGANGSIDPVGDVTKDYGSSQLFTAMPDVGYDVNGWYLDGVFTQEGGSTFTLSDITAAHSVSVAFNQKSYTIRVIASGNGIVTPMGELTMLYGTEQIFNVTPDTGFEVNDWLLDGTVAQTGGNTYTLSNITADHSLAVNFKMMTYTITASAGANGSINPAGDVTKDYGSSQMFEATPGIGYDVNTWFVDGSPVQEGGSTYTLTDITANHAVSVEFSQHYYTILVSADAHGSVVPTGNMSKLYGAEQIFNATPETGYEVDQWLLDGTSVQTGGTAYTLSNITADHTLSVNFKMMAFTITASADANGSIDPAGTVSANYGQDQMFTATANTGYEVAQWFVDAVSVQTGGDTYTLTNVTAAHSISVTFNRIALSISGYIKELDGITPLADVMVSTGEANVMTDANGFFEFEVDYGWSGAIYPLVEGYTFEPSVYEIFDVNENFADVNFTATYMTFKISGYIWDGIQNPVSGVNVMADNGGGSWTTKYGGGSAVTNASGYYELVVDYNWSGNVTTSKYAFAFEPANRSYVNVVEDIASQDYIASLLTYKISGYITNECEMPVAGVMVSADNGGGQAITNSEGFYEVWVNYAWSGNITPSKGNMVFTPASRNYAGVIADISGQPYASANIYDLNHDCFIDLMDLGVMAGDWMMTGVSPADFDANGQVDFADFADFATNW